MKTMDERNKETSTREIKKFIKTPPIKYFLYINEKDKSATTWTGEKLGSVSFGREYTSNMGDKRQSIRVRAINGKDYCGTYYKSAGDYARITVNKD